jgi:hypothetical protein
MCILAPVFNGDAGTFNSKAGAEYFEKNPDKKEALLGKAGAENPDKWRNNLKNYNGIEKHEISPLFTE